MPEPTDPQQSATEAQDQIIRDWARASALKAQEENRPEIPDDRQALRDRVLRMRQQAAARALRHGPTQ